MKIYHQNKANSNEVYINPSTNRYKAEFVALCKGTPINQTDLAQTKKCIIPLSSKGKLTFEMT